MSLFNNIDVSFECKIDRTPRVNLIFDAFGLEIDSYKHDVVKDVTLPSKWDVMYITGISGSGKTTLLKELAKRFNFNFTENSYKSINKSSSHDTRPIIDTVGDTFEKALSLLNSVGLSEAFVYLKRYRELSEGQKYRYYLAKLLELPDRVICIDEFLSVLDRVTATIVAYNFQRAFRRNHKKRLVVATSHTDLMTSLLPSTVIDFKYSGEHRVHNLYHTLSTKLPPPILKDIIFDKVSHTSDLSLLKYHYKNIKLPAMTSHIFAFEYAGNIVGLIVYSVPVRTFMIDKFYLSPGEKRQFRKMTTNERRLVSGNNILIVARVVTHPTFRGIGLASHMLRTTIPLVNKRIVVLSSVMANYVNFCESAGMTHIVPKSVVKFDKLMSFFKSNDIDKERIYFDSVYRKNVITVIKNNKKLFSTFKKLLETYIKKYFSSLSGRGEEESGKLVSDEFIEKYLLKLRPMNVKTFYKENRDIPIDFTSVRKFRSKLTHNTKV
jgi:ABC-type lipoprotein export system ATPase subunit